MLNMDFDQTVILDSKKLTWQKSPCTGVWRKPLARAAIEHSHVTSIVKYEPGARFTNHDHPAGEEILVLEGIFSDATGDYRSGSYLRNPKGFTHSPYSDKGCVIFVKLHQFQAADTQTVRAHIPTLYKTENHRLMLHSFAHEQIFIKKIEPSTSFAPMAIPTGVEILVLDGAVRYQEKTLCRGTWLRTRNAHPLTCVGSNPAHIWLKLGHF